MNDDHICPYTRMIIAVLQYCTMALFYVMNNCISTKPLLQ